MRTYRDIHGTEHQVQITLGLRSQIREQLQVDLLQAAVKPERLQEILTKVVDDDGFLFSVLSILEQRTVADLMSVFDGETLEQAGTAFLQALIDFFPRSSPMKEPLRTLTEKVERQQQLVHQTVQEGLMQLVQSMDLNTEASSSETPTNGSGESPASAILSVVNGNP
jgi:hypothetical protein